MSENSIFDDITLNTAELPFFLGNRRFFPSSDLARSKLNSKGLCANLFYPIKDNFADLRVEISFPHFPGFVASLDKLDLSFFDSSGNTVSFDSVQEKYLHDKIVSLILSHLEK